MNVVCHQAIAQNPNAVVPGVFPQQPKVDPTILWRAEHLPPSVPDFYKGEYSKDEAALDAAKREFGEETSVKVDREFIPLGDVKQSQGMIVTAGA